MLNPKTARWVGITQYRRAKMPVWIAPLVATALLLVTFGSAGGGTLTVNTNADNAVSQCDDNLSLREAMLLGEGGNALGRPVTTGERNQISGADFIGAFPPAGCDPNKGYWSITKGVGAQIQDDIKFANNVGVIFLTSGLPNVTWAEDIINGLKDDGTKAAIDGTNAGNVPGLRITATVGFTIRNLIIRNFQYEGLLIEGCDNGVYEGLEIYNNHLDGITITYFIDLIGNENSRGNRVGGTDLSQRNFIHSNSHTGISIIGLTVADRDTDLGNVIENNYIGLKDSKADADFGNGWDGIYLENAFGNRIGGDTAASRNVISGNEGDGILILGSGSYANRVINNFIGTNKDANAVIGNTLSGISLRSGAGQREGLTVEPNRIGEPGKGNVIGGNYYGIFFGDAQTSENIVRGNFIGTDSQGFLLGNPNGGIAITGGTHHNIIGGAGAGEPNVIAYNKGAGIFLDSGANNSIRCNSMYSNEGLGIDLGFNGVTINDFNDPDTGPNNLQNFPLISGGGSGGGFTSLSGSINTTADTALTLDFFVSPDRDPSNYGEGSTYIGSTTVTTNNIGNAGFSVSFHTILSFAGFYASATATDPNGNTSEFSPGLRIGCNYTVSPTGQSFPTAGGTGSFNVNTSAACDWQADPSDNWISITSGGTGTGGGTVNFSVAANPGVVRTGTITVGGRLFTINQASDCTYSLVSNLAGYPASGGNDGNSVIAPAGCTWMAISNVPWVTITSGANSSGTASFGYSVAVNTGPPRQGTLTVAGLTYTINQASGCTYNLSHFLASYPASGTSGDGVSVSAGASCTWEATTDATWITITSGFSGTGNGAVLWSVAANTGPARQGKLTIAGLTFTINQASGCTYSLSHFSAGYPASGTGSDGVSVSAGAGCTWTTTKDADWITITGGTSGTGDGVVSWSVAPNFGPPRQGHLTIAGLTFTISQGGTAVLANISTRLRVQGGDNVLIGGMIVTGTDSKKVILRALGPVLTDLGVPNALADPTLELFQGNTLVASNDDWKTSAQQAEIANSGLAPGKDAESAIIAILTPNQNYTAIVRGKNGQTGVGVVEAFDLDQAAASKLANISTRGFVGVDDNVMIAGLILAPANGSNTKILVRALGPTLGDLNVPAFLADPTLDLVNSSGTVLRSNDNWKTTQQTEIQAAQLAPAHDEESALIETLPPGAYTAIVRGSGRTTGVALVEVYNIP